jgi:hypothetical protein
MNSNIQANTEVCGHKWSHTVALEYHLALEESSLWNAGVALLWLDNHDGFVLQEVVNENLVDSVIFKSALNDALFEVTVKAEHLYYN